MASPSLLDRLREAREYGRQAGPMLVAELGARESPLDHCHQGLAVLLLLERELEFGIEARSIQAGLRRGEDKSPRRIDHLKHVPVSIQLTWGGTEVHGPHPADSEIALRSNNPARIVPAVERLLTSGLGEGGEHLFRRGINEGRESQVVAHPRSALRSST